MGIYDREYYRREGPSFLGSFTQRGQVCKWLIGINIIFFVFQLLTREWPQTTVDEDTGAIVVQRGREGPMTENLELRPSDVLHGQVWRVLTYAFLHSTSGLLHLVFNMLFLWWFGTDVEDIYGPREFLALYLIAAVLGGLAYIFSYLAGMGSNLPCVGASGAVMAVMVLCALHYPSRVILLFFLIPVPIWLFVVFEVAQDAFGFLTGNTGGTAVAVHLGGAAFGFVYYKMQWRMLNLLPDLRAWTRRLSRPRLRVYREEEPPVRTPAPVAASRELQTDEQLEAKLDAVLAKVARHGRGSLSESEQQILMRASEIYKKRRQ